MVLLLACGAALASADPPKRPLPDYDGRPDAPTTLGEKALWVPRVVLFPLYLTSEYVIRRPLGYTITAAERAHVPRLLLDFFTFGPEGQAGFVPTAYVDFGFRPSVGLTVWWDNALARGSDMRLHVATGGAGLYTASLTNRTRLENRKLATVRVFARGNRDLTFYGTGPRSREDDRGRYRRTQVGSSATLVRHFWRASQYQVGVGIRYTNTGPGQFDGDPSVSEQVDSGRYGTPVAYGASQSHAFPTVLLALDNRIPRPEPGTGFRIQLDGSLFQRLGSPAGHGFVRYAVTAGGYLDLNGYNRVLGLTVGTIFVDPVGGGDVPFYDLAFIGGSGAAAGFRPGRLLGRSAAVATLSYRWPIWAFLDASLRLSCGNAFDEHLRNLAPGLLRMSGTIGIESVGSRESAFQVLVGVGTENFEDGGRVESVRILFGNTRGF